MHIRHAAMRHISGIAPAESIRAKACGFIESMAACQHGGTRLACYRLTPWLCLGVRQQGFTWPDAPPLQHHTQRSFLLHPNAPC